jgi:predicted Zn-dependent protease
MNIKLPFRILARVTVLIFLLLLMTGCGAALQSVEKDKEMGRETVRQVEVDMGLYPDAEGTRYLNRIGERLVKVNPDQTFDYQFAIVDQYEPNAFSLPGGYIYVSRGFLALTNSEDELAGVMGHEIVHVSRRHSAREMAKARVPTLFALPGALVGGVISENLGNLLMAPAAIFGGGYLAFHSRQDEFESDQLGQQMAAEAGYDPAALAPILARLEAFSEVYAGQQRIPGFFDTHPSTPDRVDRVTRDAANIDWQRQPGVATNSAEYLKRLDGLLVGDDPAMGVIQGHNFLHPELNLFIKFPREWKSINNRQALFAVAPQKDGLLVMGIAGKGTDPNQVAKQFKNALYQKHRIEPTESRSAKIGILPAHLLTYTDTSGEEPVHMHFLWIAYRGLIYQFVGLAPERYRKVLRETALSFRPLSSDEKASIRETRLRVVSARSGESLQQLSTRTGNVWDLKITAVVNGLDKSQTLKKGQLVKIAVSQPYRSQR